MAFFGVTFETIETARAHPNADRLDLCTLKGCSFQFVTGRGEYRAGDNVLYFPIDSLLPLDVQEKLGLVGKLAGPNKNRIKTIRLRGEISQGIVAPQKLVEVVAIVSAEVVKSKEEWEQEITEWLGVTKYEPPSIKCNAGNLKGLPCGLTVYDIEGAERFPDVIAALMDQPVMITEKIEGQNFSATYSALDNRVYINQRRFTIEPLEEGKTHWFWELARNNNLIPRMGEEWEKSFLGFLASVYPGQTITIYGEAYGPSVQGNIYAKIAPQLGIFDIKVGEDFLDALTFLGLANDVMPPADKTLVVPILYIGKLRNWLAGQTLVQASHGTSVLNPQVLREGIVIRPLIEAQAHKLGRVIIKQRDPIYLCAEA